LLTDQSIAERREQASRSTGRLILLDTCAIASLTLLVKLAGAAKSVIAARFFGTGNALDCYLVAFLIPSFFSDVLAGAINPALVPKLIEAAEHDGERAFQGVYAHAFYRGTLLLSAVSLFVLASAHFVIRLLGSGFSPSKISLAQALMIVLLPVMPLSAIGVVWRSALNARGRFIAAATSPLLTPLVLIACVMLFATQYGIFALGAGTTIGCGAELLSLGIAIRHAHIPILPSWRLARISYPQLWQQYASIVINNLALGSIAVVNQAMAATLGPGSVSTLALANRATGLLLTIGPSALMIAGLPRLAKMAALHQWAALRRITLHLMLVSMLLASALSTILFVLSTPIVRFLFQGDHFTAADTLAVAHLQALSVLQLPLAVGSAILARILVLLQLKKLLIYISAGSVFLGLLLNYILMKPYGISGIAIATVVGQALVLIVLIAVVSRHLQELCRRDLSRASEETFSEL